MVFDHAIAIMVEKAGARADVGFGYALGDFGVGIFFAISGFVMVLAHGRDFGDPAAPRRFIMRRVGRILPLYAVVTLCYAAKLTIDYKAPGGSQLVRSLLFIPYQPANAEYGQPVVGQGWTLSYEMFFYVTFSVALVLRRGLVAVVLAFALLVACGLLGMFPPASWLGFWSRPIVLFFLGGLAVGLARRRLGAGPGFRGAVALTSILIGCGVLATKWGGDAGWLLRGVAAIGCVAACGLAREAPSHRRSRWLARTLGDATYSIYLTHTFVVASAARVVARFVPSTPVWLFVALMIPLTTLVGVLVYRLVERPMIRGWASVFGRPRAPGIDAVRPEEAPRA